MASTFSARAIATATKRVKVRLLRSRQEAADLFRLRQQLYVDAGFLPHGAEGEYRDRFDRLASTINLGVFDGTACRGGLRLSIHRAGDNGSQLPCGELEAVRALKAQTSGPVVELSRLVVAPTAGNIFYRTSLTALLIRTSMIFCRAVEAQYALIAARPMLVSFYREAMGFQTISAEVPYPPGPGDEPVVLMAVELADAYARHGHAYFEIGQDEVERLRREIAEPLFQEPSLKLSRKAG